MLPNFLLVGAEKAGTTTLARMLAQHPDIFMCEPKEPRFFSEHNWDKGLAWYESFFEGSEQYKAIGEASPAYTDYTNSAEIAKRIVDILGNDVKYIYIVRHPVERMLSHYRHALFHRMIPEGTSLAEAIDMKPKIKTCSFYYHQIEQYLPYTSRDQWYILTLENLVKDKNEETGKLFEFLDVDPHLDIEMAESNVTDKKRQLPPLYLKLLRSVRRNRIIQGVAGRGPLKSIAKKTLLAQVERIMGKTVEKPILSGIDRKSFEKAFSDDAIKLSRFTGHDYAKQWSLWIGAKSNNTRSI